MFGSSPRIKKEKHKKVKRKTNPDDVCYAHLCLLLGRSESKFCLFISPIHIQTSSFGNLVCSKIAVYQGRKVSKSLWIFLCVKSLWSQDRRGVKPTIFWMYVCVYSLRKFSSLKCKPQSSLKMVQPLRLQAMMNSDFISALTSGFHTESSKSRSREPSLDILLLLLLRPALRLGSQWYGARESRRAFLRRRFCCMSSCSRSTLQRVARFSVWRNRSPKEPRRKSKS